MNAKRDSRQRSPRMGWWPGLLVALLLGLLWLGLSGAASPSDPFAALKLSRIGAGQRAPAFQLKALDGREISLEQSNGKVVLVNFWAAWCGPCKEEMPSLNRLRQQVGPDRFDLLTVTADIRPQEIRTFLRNLALTVPVLLDEDSDVSGSYLVRGLPTTVLIGKDGKVVGRAVGPRDWDNPEAVTLIRSLTEATP